MWTDIMNRIIAFRNFANLPKNDKVLLLSHSQTRIISGDILHFNSVNPMDSQLQVERFN